MQQLQFRRWILEYDAEATSAAYAASRPIGPEQCGCLYCRNFIAARDHVYPRELRELASTVGINPLTETETWDNGPRESGDLSVRLCGGFFYFVFYFLSEPSLLPAAFEDKPVVQVEFSLPVPWVVEEAPPP